MSMVSGKPTVYFDEPFWVGVFERIEDGKLSVVKVTFGAEPKDYEVYEFILRHYYRLQFSSAVAAVVKERKKNPKSVQRKVKSRKEKLAETERMFELKQQKKKEKHRGR